MVAPEVVTQWDTYAATAAADVAPAPDQGCVDLLTELARGGRALDLGPGTGRVAVPLAQAGTRVTALDISPVVLDQLRTHVEGLPVGSVEIDLVEADMARFTLTDQYTVIYSTWSTLFALLTQDDQVACFQHAAAALAPGGVFVVDAFAPLNDPVVHTTDRTFVRAAGEAHVDVSYMRHSAPKQRIRFQEVRHTPDGSRLTPVDIRYAWPSEMDLMARLAGLSLSARYADWVKAPFTATSYRHVSIYAASPQT